MDSYGDGNTYRGQKCRDPEIKTIEIHRYNADVERLVEAARVAKSGLMFLYSHGKGNEHTCQQIVMLKAALEPFNK